MEKDVILHIGLFPVAWRFCLLKASPVSVVAAVLARCEVGGETRDIGEN